MLIGLLQLGTRNSPLWLALLTFMYFVTLLTVPLAAQEAEGDSQTASIRGEWQTPSPSQDDASLHAVTMVGPTIWAVGDSGVIWNSLDRGATWRFLNLQADCSRHRFTCVKFLTDRVGWVAGGTVHPTSGTLEGVLLFTRDGGANWSSPSKQRLPYFKSLEFFDLELGIAVGDKTGDFPAGGLITSNGGVSWEPLSGEMSSRWNAAAFSPSGIGIAVGDRNQIAVMNRGTLMRGGSGISALQNWRAVSIGKTQEDQGNFAWAVGDGATISRSANLGVSWESVTAKLPQQLEDYTNFQAVAQHGRRVWAAGTPGSAIWYSPDAGETWRPQRTENSIPLNAISLPDGENGVAVGELGQILTTDNGGITWVSQRGKSRRLACLAVPSSFRTAPLTFLARWSKEEGFRSAVIVATRDDIGEDAATSEKLDDRLSHAARSVGGSSGKFEWKLPVSIPMLANDREKLLQEWTQLTDRRLGDVLLSSLVGQIRTWRPSVILIDEPDGKTFSADLLRQAMTRAVELAADPTFGLNQQQISGLQPWTVQKIVLQRPPGVAGAYRLDLLELLPREGKSLDLVAEPSFGQLFGSSLISNDRLQFHIEPVDHSRQLSDRLVFGDLALAPGSDARRSLINLRDQDLERIQQQARHRKNATAATHRILSQPTGSGQLIGQIDQLVGPLTAEQAAQQLSATAHLYLQKGEWEYAEAFFVELIARYPDQQPAVDAMVWLLQYWSSVEMNWQRLRTMTQSTGQTRYQNMSQEEFERMLDVSMEKSRQFRLNSHNLIPLTSTMSSRTLTNTPTPPVMGTMSSLLSQQGGNNPQAALLDRWHRSALAISKSLSTYYPEVAEKPDVQFSVAALARRRGDHRTADEINGSFMRTISNDPWNLAARGEAYLLRPGTESPKPILNCRTTLTPPNLDGVLSDDCWRDAEEIRLGEDASESYLGTKSMDGKANSVHQPRPVVMFSKDDRFLYFAATVPKSRELVYTEPDQAGRTHDSDLQNNDRIRIYLDVDRDYTTYYQFEVDQRGHTRDELMGNLNYNPQWFCAVAHTADTWRVECAIPPNELLPPERVAGSTWAVGVTRLMPGVGVESWTISGGEQPQPGRFGLMNLE